MTRELIKTHTKVGKSQWPPPRRPAYGGRPLGYPGLLRSTGHVAPRPLPGGHLLRPLFVVALFSFLLLTPHHSFGYINYTLENGVSRIPSNSIIEIEYEGENIWIGTGEGLAVSSDDGDTWVKYDSSNGLNATSVSAVVAAPGLVWVATSGYEIVDGDLIPIGEGLNKGIISPDAVVWSSHNPEQATWYGKIVYDLALLDTAIYAACFYGGLIRSTDGGTTFENIFPDSAAEYDYANEIYADENNRFFSVMIDTLSPDTVFVYGGTAEGINKFVYTTSMGVPDTVFHYYRGDSLVPVEAQLPGNFVVALGVHRHGGNKIIWAGCRPASAGGSFAIAKSADGGQTWQDISPDPFPDPECWNFSFQQDSVVWAATGDGLHRSYDLGANWETFTYMRDTENPNVFLEGNSFYSVEVVGDTVWAGGSDGLVKTTDGGITWRVYRAYIPIGDPRVGKSYAYPVPFSTRRGDGIVRIHYKPESNTSVTIKIYDFALDLVKTVVNGKPVSAGVEYDDDFWDGYNGEGEEVANGVYFYSIDMDEGTQLWGKLVLLK